ncbi:serrate RNA effector molecule homolog [Oryzias latipes]|uniref:serrate RNA effector molecule homolog n=1 Tax=Oryzias latipes TaxID=8090 RepID=UPI0005CC06B4|nr:serrate RNA effector molecule homolog [Oryzias latipes]
MGDSDDEFDRRRRDKFRRERSDMERSREREERRRDDWPDREWDRSRERRRDYERGRRERFSPPRHMSPQHKRIRRDWWVPLFSTSGRVQSTRLLCYRRERT